MKITNHSSCRHRNYLKQVCFILVFIFGFTFNAKAQNQKITLPQQKMTILSAFEEVEKQTNLTVAYNESSIDVKKSISVDVKNKSLSDAITDILKGTGTTYRIQGQQILIVSDNQQEKKKITGKITDENGEPLIGANVVEKGTTNGTMTDVDGTFTLEVKDNNALLQVSYIGFNSQDIRVGSNANLAIKLQEDSRTLDEIIVVGYGTQKKATLTGAVVAIGNADIVTTKNENIQNMLTGKLPGLRVVQKSSEPGAFNNTFDIRGMGSPLVIIDGVPRENFTRMDANDIDNISILKDASAAIYGVRAANGVVLITTKKGKSGSMDLEYAGNIGWQNPTGSPRSVTAADWMVLRNEKLMHNVNGGTSAYTQDEIEAYRNGTMIGTDWWAECMRTVAPLTQHSLSATGGNEQVQFFISGGYLNQESFLKSNSLDYKRYNVRSNVTAQINKRFKIDLNITGIMDEKNQPYENSDWIIRAFQRAPAIQPVYANNNPEYLMYGLIEGDNPVAMMDGDVVGYKKLNNKWFQSSVTASYDLPYIDGLVAKATYSFDYQIADNRLYKREHSLYEYDDASDKYNAKGRNSPSTFRREYFSKQADLYQLSLNYARTFNKSHNVSALALIEGSKKKGDNFFAQRELALGLDQLFAGNSKNQQGSMSTTYDPTGTKNLYETANLGIVGRVGYDFESKYLAEFSFRQDGSSVFASDRRWGFFPSASLGWRISEENFWKNSPLAIVNNLKLRGSYGKMGDDTASMYQFVNGYTYPASGNANQLPGGYVFDGVFVNSAASKGITNPNITWYIAKTLNLGVDADIWNGLLGISFDYFTRNRTGLLVKRDLSLPSVVGAELPLENLNGDFTQGIELELSHKNKIGDFNYQTRGIFSFTRIKRTHDERAKAGNSYENWRNNNNERYVNIHWGYDEGGRFNSYQQIANSDVYYGRGTLPGDYIYLDWNGDGRINDLDVQPIAYEDSKTPFINFSFIMDASWRRFDFNMLWQGSAMTSVKYIEQLREPMWGNDNSNALEFFMDRWHPTDPKADPYDHTTTWVSGKYAYTGSNPDENSKFNMHNASYIRLKSLELGYTLPTNLTMKAGIKNARVYVNGYNIVTLKSVELDPEHPNDSYGNLYPLNRTFSVGVNVKF
ncbi:MULTISPECIES: TonB-dependent receptor [unclassified Dysgonomonas]|uniref:TonB-dependent receptor n=1 Tax=unclassified Dysgonomonas TaxID=2630389 RepID=UPI0013EAA7C8|nr:MULTISPECIES: TonB-dependent receptor [unclassified Dysgonomonas]